MIPESRVHDLKEQLFAEAKKKHPDNEEEQRAYVFGTLRKLGWKPKRERAQ